MERRPQRPKTARTGAAAQRPAPRHAPRHDPLRGATAGEGTPRDQLDPDLRAYLRAPYDPLNSARATRFVARGLLQQPPARGWMRPLALVVALACLGGLIGNLAALLGLIMGGSPDAIVAGLQALVVFGPVGAFGAVLLRRVLRAWGR